MQHNLEQQYDAVPFPGQPIARSQPEFLETVARLRGLQPAASAGARVLELGCAAGANLLPLAERYPRATFLGVDLSARQIATADALARQLSLANVTFQHADLRTLGSQLGQFDYIIAHGLYSWIEPPARDRLLGLCRELLAPQGIAYVNYKTFPGWKLHEVLRHMMRYDGRQYAAPQDKVTRARQFLQFAQDTLKGDSPYERVVRDEAALVLKQRDDYIWHDHLADIGDSIYFDDFVRHAAQHDLEMIGDVANGIRYVDYIGPEVEQDLAALTSDPMEQEQFRDIIRNRGMRGTLLRHRGDAFIKGPKPEQLTGMYLEGPFRAENATVDLLSAQHERFVSGNGTRVGSPVPVVKAALLELAEAWPDYVRLDDLLARATQRLQAAGSTAEISDADVAQLQENMLQCCLGHVVVPHVDPPQYVAKAGPMPAAGALSRRMALTADVVPNRRHDAVRLDSFDRQVLSHLDGTLTREQLSERLVNDILESRLLVSEKGKQLSSPEDARRAIDATLSESLNRLARAALLTA